MIGSISIRVATPGDEAAVTALLRASYPALMADAYEPAVLAAALPLITRANPALLESGTWYLAFGPGDRLAGCGGWTHEQPGKDGVTPGTAHIRHFATDPAATRCGVGRALYERTEHAARSAGVTRFECYSSLNAEMFYASLGFVRIRETLIAMRPDILFPSIHMERSIAPA